MLFCYDIELPSEFEPKAVDGEVDEFFLRDLDKVMKLMDPECDDPIKPNCYLVIIDFFLRNGILTPETPGYLDILRELRSGDCVIIETTRKSIRAVKNSSSIVYHNVEGAGSLLHLV